MGRRSQDNQIDWELIEKEYRLGQHTLRQLAATHKVQASAISRKAKKEGWVQDKSQAVKALSEAQLLVSNTHKATDKATPTAEDIAVAATARTNLILGHRQDISRGRKLFQALIAEIEIETENLPLFQQLGELLDESGFNENGTFVRDRINEIYRKVISSGGRVESAKKLVETLEKLNRMEREAFGITEGQQPDANPLAALLTELQKTRSALPVAEDPE